MRRYFILLFVVCSVNAYSQRMSIGGNVQDTVLKTPMKFASVMVIRLRDSVLLAHTRTDANGVLALKTWRLIPWR
jgi:hypothetical protein